MESGEYEETFGQYSQAALLKEMRTPPPAPQADTADADDSNGETAREDSEKIADCELSVFAKGPEKEKALFTATLRGPAPLLADWEAACEAFERDKDLEQEWKEVPFPVFIPSRGRSKKANLNWQAEHVYGANLRENRARKLRPVVCVVLERDEEPNYRKVWPSILTLMLPKSGRGAGYARWVIQKVCTKHFVWKTQGRSAGKWLLRRMPWVWVVDDNLSMFYNLITLDTHGDHTVSTSQRLKRREASEGARMFQDAFLAVQRHSFTRRAAVAGYLRDDGTAVCKKLEWKKDELSLYKVVLLNLRELERLGVQYQPDLRMYEDIFLTHQVVQAGGSTLKCQKFCFRASHHQHGGCIEQRTRGHGGAGTRLDDLIAPAALKKLSQEQQVAIKTLFEWVQKKERWSQDKQSSRNHDHGY